MRRLGRLWRLPTPERQLLVRTAVLPATCLTQAIALQILLGRRGRATDLRLGVAHGEGRRLEAHAWLEADRHLLVGAAGRERYTALPPSTVDSSTTQGG